MRVGAQIQSVEEEGWMETGEIMRVLPESGARQNYNLGDVIPPRRNGLHIPRRRGWHDGWFERRGRTNRWRSRCNAIGARGGRPEGDYGQGNGGGKDLSTARSALTRRRKLERYCISEAMIAPRRLALNCIRSLQEFSRHYAVSCRPNPSFASFLPSYVTVEGCLAVL